MNRCQPIHNQRPNNTTRPAVGRMNARSIEDIVGQGEPCARANPWSPSSAPKAAHHPAITTASIRRPLSSTTGAYAPAQGRRFLAGGYTAAP